MKKLARIVIISVVAASIAILGGCIGASRLTIDRWSRTQIDRAPDGIMQALADAGTRRDWPNAHTVSIYDTDSTFFLPDGNQISSSYSLTKLLTMKSTKDYGTIPIGYDTQQMTIDILYIRVIYPDSSVVTVSDSSISDETMEGFSGMDIYWSNLRQKVIHMPELEVGCGIEVAIRIETTQPMIEGQMDYSHGFQGDDPVIHSEGKLVVPISEEMNWKVFNDPDGKVNFSESTFKDSLRIYHWAGDDFPVLVSEPAMPSASEFLTKVLASNTTWPEYSRKVYGYSKPNMVSDDAIRETVADLTKDSKSDMDSIRAISYYVAQKIRYIGLSLGEKEGITPHDVRETFKAQCGVCKDKAALLTVMLNEAGFETYVALSNPVQKVYKEVAANQFNHMIVVTHNRAGKEIWIDPTDALCMDLLPAYHMTKASLICSEKGNDLMFHPVLPPETQSGNIVAESEIKPDGKYVSHVTISGKGIYDELLRIIFQQMEKTRQRRFWTDMLKRQVHPSARITSLKVSPSPIDDLWKPATIEIDYEIPDYAIVAGDYLLVKAPVATGAFDIMGLVLGQTTGLTKRTYPLNIQFTVGSNYTETIALPGGYSSKSLPADIDMDNQASSFAMSYRLDENKVIYRSSFAVKKPQIPPDEYEDYRNTVKKSGSAGQGMIILTEKGGAK